MTTQWAWYTLKVYEGGYLNALFCQPDAGDYPRPQPQWIDEAEDSKRFPSIMEARRAEKDHPLGPLVRVVRVVIRVEDV